VWQTPVALISTITSPALRPLQVELDDLERLLGLESHGGARLHRCLPLDFAAGRSISERGGDVKLECAVDFV
jgi:hypothetical protein